MSKPAAIASAISIALFAGITTPAFSQETAGDTRATGTEEIGELDRIAVTGSRIRRTDYEGVAPVTVITTEDIEQSGFTSVEDFLQAAVGNVGRTIEGNESSWTQGAHTINLRGMGANRTLVLVNGKRIPQYPTATGGSTSFVDISTFPSSAIERVEILSGGASAIYGSDAIGGVVNIILKQSFDGSAINLRGETTHEGGRDRQRASFTTGINSRFGQTMLVVDFAHDEVLRQGGRKFTNRWGVDGNNLASSTSLRFQDRDYFYHDVRDVFPTEEQCRDVLGEYAVWYPLDVSSTQCRFDTLTTPGLTTGKKEYNVVMNHSKEFNSGWDVNWLLQASDRTSTRANSEKGISPDIFMDRNNPGVYSYDAADFDDPVEFRLRRRLADYGQLRNYTGEQENLTSSLSVGKAFNDYDLEMTWSYGKASFFRRGRNQMLADELLQVVSFDPADSLNPDKWYPMDRMTPEQIERLYAETLTDAGSGLNQLMAVFSGDLMELSTGPMQFALSGEWTREWYFDEKDEHTLAGNLLGQGGTQGRGDRKRYAIAGELAVPLVNSASGHMLDASLAARYDYYDDESSVGGAFTPQFGLMYRPNQSLLLRANAGRSFRAPDMHRLYAGVSRSFTSTSFHVDPNHPAEPDRFESISAGNTDLHEERGKFFNIGAVFQPTDNLSGMIDFWNISLRGAVYTESVDRLLSNPYYDRTGEYNHCSEMSNLGFLMHQPAGQDYADVFCVRRGTINSAYEASRGIDAELEYRWDAGNWGNFRLRTRVSHVLKKEYQAFDDSPRVEETEEHYLQKWKGDVSLNWRYNQWTSNIAFYYLGAGKGIDAWSVDGGLRDVESRLGTFNRLNVNASYDFNSQHRLSAGITNLLNKMPPEYAPGHPSRNSVPYFETNNGYNVIGRIYSMSYEYRF